MSNERRPPRREAGGLAAGAVGRTDRRTADAAGTLLAFAVLAAEVARTQLAVDVRQMDVRLLLLPAALLLAFLLLFFTFLLALLLLLLAPLRFLLLLLLAAVSRLLVPLVAVPVGLGLVGDRLAMSAAGPAQLAFRAHLLVVAATVARPGDRATADLQVVKHTQQANL